MQFGLVTYQWGKDWDLPTLLSRCAQAGADGVELRTTHKHGVETSLTPAQRREVADRFADSPVTLVGLGSTCEYHSPDRAELAKQIETTKEFIKLCHDVGGSGVKVRPNGLPEGVPESKTIEQIGRSLREVAEFGQGYGVEIRLEVHGKGTSDLGRIAQMMAIADHPSARVCWNCNAADRDGEGLAANFNKVREAITIVHLHDLRQETYPWPELFGLLRGANFEGWTLIEESNIPPDIVAALTENRRLWNRLSGG